MTTLAPPLHPAHITGRDNPPPPAARPGTPGRRGPLLAPLGLLTLVNSIAVVALLPAVRHALAGTPDGARSIETAMWASAAASPLLGMATAALVALCLWAVLSLGGRDVAWRPLLSVALGAEVVRAAQSLFIAGVLYLRGLDALRAPADLQVPTGLDIFFDLRSPAMLVLAEHLGVFSLAWVAALTWGTRAVTGAPWVHAAAAALVPWAIAVTYALVQRGTWL